MTDDVSNIYLQALTLGIEPAWRRRTAEEREADVTDFLCAEEDASATIRSRLYTSVGLEPGVDLLLWRRADSVDDLEVAAARTLRSGLGMWSTVRDSLLGRTSASQYLTVPPGQEVTPMTPDDTHYLIVYPFTKSTDWYLLSREARQGVMNEHMKVGRQHPDVRQALAYSYGMDDGDFLVAYETNDLADFGELVRELRGTESRRSTVRDTPILLGIRRSADELRDLLL